MEFSNLIMVATIVEILITIFVASRPASENQKWLLLTFACVSVCSLLYFFEISSEDISMKCMFFDMNFMFKGFAVVSYFEFVASYTAQKLRKWESLLMFLVAYMAGSLCTMNSRSQLIYTCDGLYQGKFGTYLQVDYHLLYYLVVTVYLIVAFSGILSLIRKILHSHGQEHVKTALLLFATLIPIVGLIYRSTLDSSHVDWMNLSFSFSVVTITIIIGTMGLTDVTKIAVEAVINSAKEGLIVVDRNRTAVYANETALSRVPNLLELKGEEKKMLAAMFEQPTSYMKRDGREYEVRISSVMDGPIHLGYMALILDVTEANEHNRQMVELKKEAENANLAKSQFLADMSHEIRTPMNAILGFSELMMEEKDHQVRDEYAKDIHDSATLLLGLINKILDISRIESGRLELKNATYSTWELFTSVGNIIGLAARNKGLEYSADIAEDMPEFLCGDSSQLHEIMINLLNNSVKYTMEGSVTLQAFYEKSDAKKGNLHLTVKDTGLGMSPEYLQEIFEKFSRVESEENRNIEGTGLGMAIVKGLVDAMGGTIDIQSEEGEGSVFTVVIPQTQADEQQVSKTAQEKKEEGRHFFLPECEFLVVDDNALNRKVISSILKKYQVKTDLAESGLQALAMMEGKRYDLVFMDQMMPGMDGVTALKQARKLPGYEKAKIAVLTANAIVGVKEKMLEEGFDGYLSKPLERPALNELLLDLLPQEKVVFCMETATPETEPDGAVNDRRSFETFASGGDASNLPVDFAAGLAGVGGEEEAYREILSFVSDNRVSRRKEVEDLFAKEDWENYTINVHGMKSSMRSIGALELSDFAKEMETAGRTGNIDYLKAHHDRLLDLYDQALDLIDDHLKKGASSVILSEAETAITEGEKHSILENIKDLVDRFDLPGAEEAAGHLLEFELGEDRERVQKLKEQLGKFDYEKSLELITKLLTEEKTND